MRITNGMMVSSFLADANASLNRVAKYQEQVHSTKRIANISDDPIGTINALKARGKIKSLETYQANIKTARSWLVEAESSVYSLNEVTQNAYESLVSAINGTKTDYDRNVFAEEIKNLRDEVLAIAKSTLTTNYIYGGYNVTGSKNAGTNKQPPFMVDESTGYLYYNGIMMSPLEAVADFENAFDTGAIDLSLKDYNNLTPTSTDSEVKTTISKLAETLIKAANDARAAVETAKALGLDENDPDLVALSDAAADAIAKAKDLQGLCSNDIFDADAAKLAADDAIAAMETMVAAHDQVWATNNTDFSDFAQKQLGALKGQSADVINIQIGTDQVVGAVVAGTDLLGIGENNLYYILDSLYNDLINGASFDDLSPYITKLQDKQSDLLTLETYVGSTINRLDMLDDRYTESTLNFKEMLSDNEDVDMAEAITNLSNAQTTYNAALAAGANSLQISLIDFLK